MPETYRSVTAFDHGAVPVVRVALWGIPATFTGHTTPFTPDPLSLVHRIPENYSDTSSYKAVLLAAPTLEEGYDPTTGKTTLGSIEIRLQDTFDGYFADLFGKEATRKSSLTATLTESASAVDVSVAIQQGQVYFLGDETLVAQATGTSSIVVSREVALTRRRLHFAATASNPTPDDLFDRPPFWKDRIVGVYFGYDHADLDEGDELGPFLYRIRNIQIDSDGNWLLECDSFLAELDRKCMWDTWRPTLDQEMPAGEVHVLKSFTTQSTVLERSVPHFTDGATLLIDDEVVEVDHQALIRENWHRATLRRRGMGGTKQDDHDAGAEVKEVLLSDPTIDYPRFGTRAWNGSGWDAMVASDHPLIIAANLMISNRGKSSGAGTFNANNGRTSFDVLPIGFGLDIDIDRFLEAEILRVASLTPHARTNRFRIGHDGGFKFRGWMDEQVTVLLGYAVYSSNAGRISFARIGDAYPGESVVAVSGAKKIHDYHGMDAGLPNTTGRIVLKYKSMDGREQERVLLSAWATSMSKGNVRTLTIDSEGLADQGAFWVMQRLTAILARENRAQPRMTFELPWSYHDLVEVGTLLDVDDPDMVDWTNGGYGVESEKWRVLTRRMVPDIDTGHFRVEVSAVRANFGSVLFGPAAEVDSWDAGSRTATLKANEFTPTTELGDIPDADVKLFGPDGSQGGVGLAVAVYNKDGSRRDTNSPALEVESLTHASHKLVFDALPDDGAPFDPSGHIIRLHPLTATISAAVDAGSYSDDHDDYMALADDDTHLINASEPGRPWGA